jgi:hypothetical protein
MKSWGVKLSMNLVCNTIQGMSFEDIQKSGYYAENTHRMCGVFGTFEMERRAHL